MKPRNTDLALCSNKRSSRGRLGEIGIGGSSWKRGSSSQRRQSQRKNQGMQSNRNDSKSCFYCG
jgi:hypothetical protein